MLDAAKGLEFRSVITANLLIDKEQVTSDTWLYVQEPDIGFARIHEPRNWSSAMAPPGKTSLCMEWFCSVGDEIWELSDDEIVERTVAHLVDELGFVDRSDRADVYCFESYPSGRGRLDHHHPSIDFGSGPYHPSQVFDGRDRLRHRRHARGMDIREFTQAERISCHEAQHVYV